MIEPSEEIKRVEQRYEKALDDMEKYYKDVLDKIRAEINTMFPSSGAWMYEEGHEVEHTVCEVLSDVLQIIDKHTNGDTDENSN